MPGTRPALASLLASLGLAVAACGGGQGTGGGYGTPPATTTAQSAGGATLDGTVGPGFEIELTRDGQPVTTLAPGTYTLNVDDKSGSHNFHLTGPGVDVSTDVSFTGEDVHDHARERHVPLPVRPARELDERRLDGLGLGPGRRPGRAATRSRSRPPPGHPFVT